MVFVVVVADIVAVAAVVVAAAVECYWILWNVIVDALQPPPFFLCS